MSAADLEPPAAVPALTIPKTLPLLIAALSTLGPFAIDTYLPSFHDIERALGATPLQVQQSLTAYLIPFAFMTLWHGSLSDAFGRRRVILVAMTVVTLASIGCAAAPNLETLLFCRVIQGLASGIFVVGRAVIRDVYEGPAAQRVVAQVSVLFAIAPAIAPVLGGWLQDAFGWRSVFIFVAAFAALLTTWSAISLPETLPVERRQPPHFATLLRSYGRTFVHARFLAAALAAAFNFTAIFLYIASAPALLLGHLQVRETQFFWLFGPVTAGMMLGGVLSGKLAGRLTGGRTLAWSYVAMLAAAAANIAFHLLHAPQLPWSVAPLFFYAAGIALSLPTLTLIGLDLFPAQRGLAASCQAFLLTGMNAITAGVLAPFASFSAARLSQVSGALVLVGLGCTGWYFAARRAAEPAVAV